MSLVVGLYVREGIVLASDSRLTLNVNQPQPNGQSALVSVPTSDSNYKTFLAPGRVGIGTYGAADIAGVPLAGFIESFILEKLDPTGSPPKVVADRLLDYFSNQTPRPNTGFIVAGYAEEGGVLEQQIWGIDIAGNRVTAANKRGEQGAAWGGEKDIVSRLVMPVATLDEKGQIAEKLPMFPLPYQFFTLQDAIDFAVFAIGASIDAMRFQPRPKTIGRPVDVLVIKPTEAFWVQRKELHA